MTKNKQNNKDRDVDVIVEVLDKYKEYGETAEGRETDVIHWRNFEKIATEILSKLKENEIVLAEAEICKVFWIKEYNHLCFELRIDESLWISEKDFPSSGNYKLIFTKSRGD